MNARQNQTYPLSKEEQELEDKIKYWKDNASEMLQLNSYNTNKWNKFGTSGKNTDDSQRNCINNKNTNIFYYLLSHFFLYFFKHFWFIN